MPPIPSTSTSTSSTDGFTKTSLAFAPVNDVYLAELESLRDRFTSFQQPNEGKHATGELDNGIVLVDTIRKPDNKCSSSSNSSSNTTGTITTLSRAFYRAGRRKGSLHFDPSSVNAAIVTCGGLCPGLNNVIRELVRTLKTSYGVQTVWGVVGGWNGFCKAFSDPIELTPKWVEAIHHTGGSALKTSRGGLNVEEVVQFLQDRDISQLYIIGGDGTHRAAYKVHEHLMSKDLNIAVAGIPKTIDNDIDFLDRSFGFNTAVEAAQNSIRSALVEARCTLPNGIGVVKLMGRSAGYLAAFAALSSGDVDAVLVPEIPVLLEDLLPHIYERVKQKKHAVIVVAEGAGKNLLAQSGEKEAGSGNDILPPIAEYIRDKILEYYKSKGEPCRMKYIDPSYQVRSVPANAADALYCTQLAHNAVHGCMSGLTGFSVGMVNNRTVYIPIPQLVENSPRSMDPANSPIWDRILAMTGQPHPSTLFPDQDDIIASGATTNGDTNSSGDTGDQFPRLPEPTVH
jgi:6-phosphofructokinase 1